MAILYAGDIHGQITAVKNIDKYCKKNKIETVVQVGDFGVQWSNTCKITKYFEERESGPMWLTCGGNHENYDRWFEKEQTENISSLIKLTKSCFWVKRGTILIIDGFSHLFLGGAESIDQHARTENVNWWRYETPTREEFNEFATLYEDKKPDIIITHDAPTCVKLYKYGRESQITPHNLQRIWELSDHKPKYWYFGHHHIMEEWQIEETTFRCCGLHGQYWSEL